MLSDRSRKILVASTGNILRSDDGLGPFVIDRIRRLGIPQDIDVIDLGTPGLLILQYVEKYEKVVLVDAIRKGGKPGSIYRLKPQDVADDAVSLVSEKTALLSMHEVNLEKSLAVGLALGVFPLDTVLIGCEPGDINTFRVGLTDHVRRAVPGMVALVLNELGMDHE